MLTLLLLHGFLIFSISWLRVLLFVQVFKIKSACNLILLGKSLICKFLFLLFIVVLQLLILSCIYTHVCVCVCAYMHTQGQIPPVIFHLPDFVFKELESG